MARWYHGEYSCCIYTYLTFAVWRCQAREPGVLPIVRLVDNCGLLKGGSDRHSRCCWPKENKEDAGHDNTTTD